MRANRTFRLRAASAALPSLLLAACAVAPSPTSPYYQPPVHTALVLEKPITIPAVSVWIQDGRVETGAPDSWRPACKLEMWTKTEEPRTLEPDTFDVTSVSRDMIEVAAPARAQRAGLRLGLSDQGGPMAYIMRTTFDLHSDRQPDVYRLACSHWDDPVWRRHLTVEQMRATLKGVFRLVLPADREPGTQ